MSPPEQRQSASTCPDCLADVREAVTSRGLVLAEEAEGGPWVLRSFGLRDEPAPTALRATAVRVAQSKYRYRLHKCSRRAKVSDDLATLSAIYAGRRGSPRLTVPLGAKVEGEQPIEKGDALTLVDGNGGEVRAEVQAVQLVAVPRWETFRQGKPDHMDTWWL